MFTASQFAQWPALNETPECVLISAKIDSETDSKCCCTCGVGHEGMLTNCDKSPPFVTQVLMSKNRRYFLSLKNNLNVKLHVQQSNKY